jgi:hypothetical protein
MATQLNRSTSLPEACKPFPHSGQKMPSQSFNESDSWHWVQVKRSLRPNAFGTVYVATEWHFWQNLTTWVQYTSLSLPKELMQLNPQARQVKRYLAVMARNLFI